MSAAQLIRVCNTYQPDVMILCGLAGASSASIVTTQHSEHSFIASQLLTAQAKLSKKSEARHFEKAHHGCAHVVMDLRKK